MMVLLSTILPISVGMKNTSNGFIDETGSSTTSETNESFANANCFVVVYGKCTYLECNWLLPMVMLKLRWWMDSGSCWTLGTTGFQKCRNVKYIAGTADYAFIGMTIKMQNRNSLIIGMTKWVGVQIVG